MLARACWGTGSSASDWSAGKEQHAVISHSATPGVSAGSCTPSRPHPIHQPGAETWGTPTASLLLCKEGTALRQTQSHLFDVEEQQQLHYLHCWQEWCEENPQPGRETERDKLSCLGGQFGAQKQQDSGASCTQCFAKPRASTQRPVPGRLHRLCSVAHPTLQGWQQVRQERFH